MVCLCGWYAELGLVATVAAGPGIYLLFPDALSLWERFGSGLQSTERAAPATSED